MVGLVFALATGLVFALHITFQRRGRSSRLDRTFSELGSKLGDLEPRQQTRAVMLAAAAIGLCLGLLNFRVQRAVELGQVLSGLVTYPPDNGFYLYQVESWNVWAQLAALGLRFGLNEIIMSAVLSGLAGAVGMAALALIVLGLTRSPGFALAGALVVCGMVNAMFYTDNPFASYQIRIIGNEHTFGMLGLDFILLCIGLIAVEEYEAGFTLIGFAPAAHPSLAIWAGLSILASLLAVQPDLRKWLRLMPYGLIGLALAAASYGIQRALFPTPAIDPAAAQAVVDVHLRVWDLHRSSAFARPFATQIGNLILAATSFSTIRLMRRENGLSTGARILLRFLLISIVVGLGFTVWVELKLPFSELVSVLLPFRFLNVTAMGYVCLLVGLMFNHREETWVALSIAISLLLRAVWVESPFLLDAMAIIPLIMISGCAVPAGANRRFILLFALTLLGALVAAMIVNVDAPSMRDPVVMNTSALAALVVVFLLCLGVDLNRPVSMSLFGRVYRALVFTAATILVTIITIASALTFYTGWLEGFLTMYGHPFWAAVSQGEGLLLTSSNEYTTAQLRSRRPLLIAAGTMEIVLYAPAGGPQIADALSSVYGIDYAKPPAELWHTSMIAAIPSLKALWELRTEDEWVVLGRRYGFTQVLVVPGWQLQLPVAARDEGIGTLYDVPTQAPQCDVGCK